MTGSSHEAASAAAPSSLAGQFNRRTFLRTAAAVGAAGVVGALLDACGSSSSTTAPATGAPAVATTGVASAVAPSTGNAASAAPAGTITIPLISNPTPNPVVLSGGLSSILLDKNLFGQLVRPDANTGAPSPDLAQKWDISPDGKVYTFSLRPGVKWHNGDPFTADDVKFTFDLMQDKKSNAAFINNLGPFAGAEIVDPMTVKLNLSAPYAALLT